MLIGEKHRILASMDANVVSYTQERNLYLPWSLGNLTNWTATPGCKFGMSRELHTTSQFFDRLLVPDAVL